MLSEPLCNVNPIIMPFGSETMCLNSLYFAHEELLPWLSRLLPATARFT